MILLLLFLLHLQTLRHQHHRLDHSAQWFFVLKIGCEPVGSISFWNLEWWSSQIQLIMVTIMVTSLRNPSSTWPICRQSKESNVVQSLGSKSRVACLSAWRPLMPKCSYFQGPEVVGSHPRLEVEQKAQLAAAKRAWAIPGPLSDSIFSWSWANQYGVKPCKATSL
jgi:hypothetical protein